MKIEVGKTYKIRNPEKEIFTDHHIITITEELTEPTRDGFRFMGSDGWTYGDDGNFIPGGIESAYDLIEEVTIENQTENNQ